MSTIPQMHVEWLMTNPTPEKRDAFDLRFGPGAAAQIIGEVVNPQPEPEIEVRSWGDTVKAVGADIGTGILKAPGAVASGLYEGAIAQPASLLSSLVGDVLLYNPDNGEWFDYISPEEFKERDAQGENYLTDLNPLVGYGEDTFTGHFINDASQFTGAFLGLGKVFKGAQGVLGGSKLAVGANTAAHAGAATFAGFAGNEGRITDMLLDMGVPDEMLPDFLETSPDDSEMMGRLKNVVEEGPLGALGVIAVKAFRAARTGDQAAFDAALEEAEAAHNAVRTRIEADLETPAAETAPEMPINGDLKPAEAPSDFPEKVDGFGMSLTHQKRLERLSEKLAKNPDADIKSSMGWRSFDLINAPSAVEAEIAATARVLSKQFDAVKGNAQSEQLWAMQAGKKAKALAEMTGVDDAKIIETVSKFDNPRTMAADLMARENYALSLSENITEISKAIRAFKDNGDIDKLGALGFKSVNEANLALLQRRDLAANVVASVQGARSNIGRAMRAMQVVRKGDENLIKIISKNGSMERTADEIVAAALDGPASKKGGGLLQNVANSTGKLGDKINFFRINALLSGPGTQEVNMISNALNGLALPIQQAVGAAVTLNPTQFLHASRTLRGIIGGSRESISSALKAAYNDQAILDPYNAKLDTQDLRAAGLSKTSKFIGLPTRFLMTADEFFKQSQYRGRIFADAVAEADAHGLKGQQKKDHIAAYLGNSFDEFGGATRGDALHQAQRATFTEELEDGFSKKVQQFAIEHSAVRYVIPFVRTPLNILSQGFQHLPVLGVLSGRLRRDLAAGGHRRSQAIGKQAIGAALATTAYIKASQGLMTGSGPKDPRVRASWLRTNKPYSFVSFNEDGSKRFTPYQRFEPFSYPLALVADFVELAGHADSVSRMELNEMTTAIVSVFAENTVNKTFTQGLADIFGLLEDSERNAGRWVAKGIGSFVPNAIPQILDQDELLEIRGVFDDALSRLGMDGHLDRRRNALGEVDFRAGSRMDPLHLFAKDDRAHDIVMEEFTRLAQVHQSGFETPPSRVGDVDLRDVAYSEDQSMFDRWMELQSTITIGRRTLRETLEKTIKSPAYQRLVDGNRDYTGRNEQILKKIILRYRDAAAAQLSRKDPRFRKLLRTHQMQRRAIKRGVKTNSLQELTDGLR